MKYSKLITKLHEQIGLVPKQVDLCRMLNIKTGAMSARVKNDSDFSDEEISKIEDFYAIDLTGSADNCITLDYYPDVFGSCGTGVFVLSEQKEKISLSKESIANYSNVANYSVINAQGDSMEPFICHKDKLIVRHWQGEQIQDNSVYVFRYLDEIFVKRLSKNIDQIVIKSDNPIYDTRKVAVSKDFQIIGQIVGLLRNMH